MVIAYLVPGTELLLHENVTQTHAAGTELLLHENAMQLYSYSTYSGLT